MSELILAVPSKGRLQEQALDFLTRSGLKIDRARGGRDYRGHIAGLPELEVAFLSASEIARELAAGNAHLGLTGLDLVHETVDDPADRAAKLHLVTPLGFGPADVVVAVPERWIDVDNMADLADAADNGPRSAITDAVARLPHALACLDDAFANLHRAVDQLAFDRVLPAVPDFPIDVGMTGNRI